MIGATTNDAMALALRALAATLGNQRLADRFLSVSGIEPLDLRQRAGDPALLAALLRFLEAHEPDLVAIAEQLGAKPQDLVAARREIEQ